MLWRVIGGSLLMGFVKLLRRGKKRDKVRQEMDETITNITPSNITLETEQQYETESVVEEKEIETKTPNTSAEDLQEEIQQPESEEKNTLDLPDTTMEDIQETETDLVEAFFDPSKKHYSDAKVIMLEQLLKRLLREKDWLLVEKNPDRKKLEEIEDRIQCVNIEIENAKYEALRFCSETQ